MEKNEFGLLRNKFEVILTYIIEITFTIITVFFAAIVINLAIYLWYSSKETVDILKILVERLYG